MPKAPKSPAAKPARAPKSKASKPELQPLGPALAELLNPAINRGTAGLGSGTGPGFAEAPQPALASEATLADKALAHRLGIGVEQAQALDIESEIGASGVTATVKALERLIQEGRPEVNGRTWVPHKPPRPEKWEGGKRFEIVSGYQPAGDQPTRPSRSSSTASGRGERDQVLLGVTGSGKTFTVAQGHRTRPSAPRIVLAPNKTLAAQLYGEFKSFFPNNAVEYFVSYYDYYQPEAYVPRSDTYIEKESSINEQIDRMRHSATRALLERDDVIIVASVSCIYGIGSVETYTAMTFADGGRRAARPAPAHRRPRRAAVQAHPDGLLARHLPCAGRHDRALPRPPRGPRLAHQRCSATRSRASTSSTRSPASKTADLAFVKVYANSHYVTPRPTLVQAIIRHQGGAELAAGRAQQGRPPAGGAAPRAAHPLRPRDDGGHRLLRRHRELFALAHRPPPRRAAADPVRIRARQRPRLRRREPCHHPADRRHVSRRLPPQGDAGRIRLPPALLHGQPPAALRGMGRHAPADRRTSRPPPAPGSWSRPAAPSPSRSSAPPA